MKKFFSKYSYDCVKLFLNQIAISMFGLVLALASGMARNSVLQITTSICAIIFYLFLEYTVAWTVGAKDRISIDLGKEKRNLWVPVKLWLLSNSLNLIVAVFITLGKTFPDIKAFSSLGGIGSLIAIIIQGMYSGVLTVDFIPGFPLNSIWPTYFIITLPALIVIFVSYLLGVKNIHFTNMLSNPNPEIDKKHRK